MFKLRRFYKPYTAMIVLMLALLIAQVLLELNLPNYMSNIVNIGLQQSGITSAAPVAISQKGMGCFTFFMSQEDKEAFLAAYTTDWKTQQKDFPDITPGDFVLIDPKADNAAAEVAFSRAAFTMVALSREMRPLQEPEELTEEELQPDMQQIYDMMPTLNMILPEEKLAQYRQTAAEIDPSLAKQTALIFVKALYTELDPSGAYISGLQNRAIQVYGVWMLAMTLLAAGMAVCVTFVVCRMGAGVARDIRRATFHKVTNFSLAQMDTFSTSSLITRTTNDITRVQMFSTMGLRMLCYAPIMGAGAVFMAVRKAPSLSWIIGLAVAAVLGIVVVGVIIAMPRFTRMQKLVDKINLVTREILSGLMVIRAFGTQKHERKRFDAANADYTKNNLIVGRVMSILMPLVMFVMSAVMLLITWAGAQGIDQNTVMVGDMMAFMQYAMQTIMAFMFLSMIFIMLPQATVSAKRIAEVLNSTDALTDPETPVVIPGNIKGRVVFDNVSFQYKDADDPVLHNISFTAEPGQTTAIIGSTGSGKSTLLYLIPRFYDVTQGSITIDGIDLRQVRQNDLREIMSFVPQKGFLFQGDIAENLRVGRQNATDDELREAAITAQALGFIEEKPQQWQEPIAQGGSNVSGGQRQRLAIARGLVRKPALYLFDDNFSALDFKTDAALRKALREHTATATVLIVAQRISTVMYADQIIVMNQGAIEAIGKHDELMKTSQTYQEIAKSQLGMEGDVA